MHRALIALVLAACTIWSVFWFMGHRTVHRTISALIQDMQDSGLEVEYADLRVRGYPNRFDTTIDEIEIVDPSSGNGWKSPFFQLLMLSYSTGHLIAVWPDLQEVVVDGVGYRVASEELKASIRVSDSRTRLEQLIVNADQLSVSELPLRASDVQFSLRSTGTSGKSYEIALTSAVNNADSDLEGVVGLSGGDLSIKASAMLELGQAPGTRFCEGDGRHLLAIKLDDTELVLPAGRIRAASDLRFALDGLPNGEIVLEFAQDESNASPEAFGGQDIEFESVFLSLLSALAKEKSTVRLNVEKGEIAMYGVPFFSMAPLAFCR